MLFVLLDEWSDCVTTEELCETVIGSIGWVNIVRVRCLQRSILQWLVQNLIDLGLLRSQKRLIRTELFLVVFELATEALDDLLEQAHLIILLLLHEVALRDTDGVHIILSWAR